MSLGGSIRPSEHPVPDAGPLSSRRPRTLARHLGFALNQAVGCRGGGQFAITGSIPLAVQGMKLGLFDFLVKPVDPDVLLSKVQAAMRLDIEQRGDVDSLRVIEQKLALLTPREHELLQLIVSGMPNKNIASELGISIKTVENHRASLMAKTGALNAADLVRMKMLATRS